MAISVTSIGKTVQTTAANTTTITGVTVPSGSLIVLGAADRSSSGTASASDSVGNTYTAAIALSNTTNSIYHTIFYVKNCTALSSNTITYTHAQTSTQAQIGALYATGVDTSSPLDGAVTATTNNLTTAAANNSVTSGTPSVSNELFVTCLSVRSGNTTITQDSTNGWTNQPGLVFPNVISSSTGAMQYQINTGTGTKTCANTFASQFNAGSIVGFKPSSGTVTTGNFFFMFN